jgi:hypothetical protein
MFTEAECLENARRKIEKAESDPRHRRKHLNAAGAWFMLYRAIIIKNDAKQTLQLTQ